MDRKDWGFVGPRSTPIPRDDLLRLAVGLVRDVPGNIVEFGVAEGHSTRVIQAALEEKSVGGRVSRRIRRVFTTFPVCPTRS